MAYREKNIEDLKTRYTAYLESLDSSDIAFIGADPELIVLPVDEISPVLDKLHEHEREVADMEPEQIKDLFEQAQYEEDTKEAYFCAGVKHGINLAVELLEGIL